MNKSRLQKFNALVLFADVLNAGDSLKKDEPSFVKSFTALWDHAKDRFALRVFGKLSRIVCIYDNIWARVTADDKTSAFSPDANAIDLWPELLLVAIGINEKAKDCHLKIIQTMAYGELWMSVEDLSYSVDASTNTPITENIFSLGMPQLKCMEMFKSEKLSPYSIGVDQGIVRAIDGDELCMTMRGYGYEVSFKEISCSGFYSVGYKGIPKNSGHTL